MRATILGIYIQEMTICTLIIIEPLGHRAKEKNDQFMQEYVKVINRFTLEFMKGFCDVNGNMLWEDIVKFSSANIPATK